MLLPRRASLLAAMLALVSQLALGAMVLPDIVQSDLAALDAAAVLCGTPAPGGHAPAPRHQAPDCALPSLAVALALPAVILGAAPGLPPRRAAAVGEAGRIEAPRTPPQHFASAGLPRGPPPLS
jgi:hypothetical protein